MAISISTPWHKRSFDNFINDRLPQLLAARLPLGNYFVEPDGEHFYFVNMVLSTDQGDVAAKYRIPSPDDDGLFEIDGKPWVVVPLASDEHLSTADISCVGEQLYQYIEERLGEAPDGLPWDEALVHTWLPLDAWVMEFMQTEPSAQHLDTTNRLAEKTHLRRVFILDLKEVITPDQMGRVCPFETPEGPNLGRVFTIAVGAEIKDGKLVIMDDNPAASLGISASMIPFVEHNDPNRLTFGSNMLRQWMTPPDPEPAMIQTGNEGAPGFWGGRNVLTAFISAGANTYNDGIVISESCAKRFGYPNPIEPGDKISNRHGSKGVISRIVPDDEMPRLPDGTPVELIYSFIGLHTRLNFGQELEAAWSRIARAHSTPIWAPPFESPNLMELQEQLKAIGLPEDSLEVLTDGKTGAKLDQPSLAGWVYWGKTAQTVDGKIMASVDGTGGLQQGMPEYYSLRDAGAYQNVLEQFNTRSAARNDASDLQSQVAKGSVQQAEPPTPRFAGLQRRLSASGIKVELENERLAFSLTVPDDALELAEPVPHPWMQERSLSAVGMLPEFIESEAVTSANEKFARVLQSYAPESLINKARAELRHRIKVYFDALLESTDFGDPFTFQGLRKGDKVSFSGKTVIAPAMGLRPDQVGIPDEMAWTLFGPMVTRAIGSDEEVRNQTDRASQELDEVMAGLWVLVERAPAVMPTSFVAFHPIRVPNRVIRLHPLVCGMMNADFDGDQCAVFVPVTEDGQREAGEMLSMARHLRRDPELIKWISPNNEALWGLARLSLTLEGIKKISEVAEVEVAAPEGFVNFETLAQALRSVMDRDGVEQAISAAEKLMQLGFEVARTSGASINPFIGSTLDFPKQPETNNPDARNAYAEIVRDRIESSRDYMNTDIGPQLLAVKSGARGSIGHLVTLIGPKGSIIDAAGKTVIVKNGYRDGLTAEELYARVAEARHVLAQMAMHVAEAGVGLRESGRSKAFTVLARAMRASNPGPVFAHAAAMGELDPLVDLDSRLFVGLESKQS